MGRNLGLQLLRDKDSVLGLKTWRHVLVPWTQGLRVTGFGDKG